MSDDLPFANRDKKPVKGGERVEVQVPWADTVHWGTVLSVLDTQFTYEDDDSGETFFCPYDGDWKKL